MENVTTTIQDKEPLIFTDSAAEKVKKLIEEEKNPSLNLRVVITGGGCSGFQYGFTFDEKIQDGDAEIAKCALGSGNYNWPSTATKDTCSDGIDANTDDNIADQLVNGMGFKNPYDQTTTVGTAATS